MTAGQRVMDNGRRVRRLAWGIVRLTVAGFLLWAVASDTAPRLARLQLASLPGFDYAGEVRFLRAGGRYGEAEVVARAGLNDPAADHAAVQAELAATQAEQSSYLRRIRDAGLGAISGRGESIAGLVGAVAADFFVVGDIRDLVIQGGRYVIDGETDEVILVLSGIGLATTLAPEVDWVPSVLKAARKAGTMTRGVAEFLVRSVRARRVDDLMEFMRRVRRLAARASPGGAVRLLRYADDPADVAKLARFVEAERAGAFALHVTQGEGAALIKAADGGGEAARAVVLASRHGDAGRAWLRGGRWRAIGRPHALVGLFKAVYKGNAADLAARVASALDPRAWWLLPLLAGWVVVEAGLLSRRLVHRRA
ncbi:MAG: hypothetical protein IT437_04480 [Phycisphaerales bacterium]|nr:hypothetical protein [Phycisphaerales bacterium]